MNIKETANAIQREWIRQKDIEADKVYQAKKEFLLANNPTLLALAELETNEANFPSVIKDAKLAYLSKLEPRKYYWFNKTRGNLIRTELVKLSLIGQPITFESAYNHIAKILNDSEQS